MTASVDATKLWSSNPRVHVCPMNGNRSRQTGSQRTHRQEVFVARDAEPLAFLPSNRLTFPSRYALHFGTVQEWKLA
uniref:Uncharacterized protein n=1 Tax=Trichuris muris TaxID=70415 RepID=A0A5S6Q8M5_TRIMR